jgi:nitric oxide reductase NorD protein
MGGGGLIDDLLKSAHYARMIDSRTWDIVRNAFPDPVFDQWSDSLSRIATAIDDPQATAQFARGSAAVARAHGTDLALATVPIAIGIAKAAGTGAAAIYLTALAKAAGLFKDHSAFRTWLRTLEEGANLAPHSVPAILSASLLGRVNIIAFRAWMLNGIRESGSDPVKCAAYFAQVDSATLKAFERDPDDVAFTDVEASLKAFVMALWKIRPVIRTANVRPGGRVMRRASGLRPGEIPRGIAQAHANGARRPHRRRPRRGAGSRRLSGPCPAVAAIPSRGSIAGAHRRAPDAAIVAHADRSLFH